MDVRIINRRRKRGSVIEGDSWVLPAGAEATGVAKEGNGIWVEFSVNGHDEGDEHTVAFWLQDVLKDRDGFTVEASDGGLRRLLADVGIEGGTVFDPTYRIDVVGAEDMGATLFAIRLSERLRATWTPVTYVNCAGFANDNGSAFFDFRDRAVAIVDEAAGGGTTIVPTILPAPLTVFVSRRPLQSIERANRIVAFQTRDLAGLPVPEPMSVGMLSPGEFLVFDRRNGGERIGRGEIVEDGCECAQCERHRYTVSGFDLAQLVAPVME
jgi:hypothetical protein